MVLVSFSSVMVFLVVSSVVVVLQGQVVLKRLVMMLSMAQEALEGLPWPLVLSVLVLRVLPLVLVQSNTPHLTDIIQHSHVLLGHLTTSQITQLPCMIFCFSLGICVLMLAVLTSATTST